VKEGTCNADIVSSTHLLMCYDVRLAFFPKGRVRAIICWLDQLLNILVSIGSFLRVKIQVRRIKIYAL